MQQQLLDAIAEMAVFNNVVNPTERILKLSICNNVANTSGSHVALFQVPYSTQRQSDSRLEVTTTRLPLWVFSLNKNY